MTTKKENTKKEMKKESKAISGADKRLMLLHSLIGKTISTPIEFSKALQVCEKALTKEGKTIGTMKALQAVQKGKYKGKAEIVYLAGVTKKTKQGSRVKFLSSTENINWDNVGQSRC